MSGRTLVALGTVNITVMVIALLTGSQLAFAAAFIACMGTLVLTVRAGGAR